MQIQVQIRNVYGNRMIYPVCEKALLLAQFARTKTFTARHMEYLRDLGYTFNNISQSLDVPSA